MSVGKIKEKKTLLALFVVLTFIMSFLPMRIRTVYAEDLTGEEQQVEQIDLQAELIWTNVPEDVSIAETTLKLLNGDELIEKVAVDAGMTVVTFTSVDKYDSEGIEIPYRLEQDPIEDFETTVNNFVVENTYIKPAEMPAEETPVELPLEEAPLLGEAPQEEETPLVEETPPVVETPPVEEIPPAEEIPPVEETPPALPGEEAPLVVETPPAVNPPLTEESPIIGESTEPVLPDAGEILSAKLAEPNSELLPLVQPKLVESGISILAIPAGPYQSDSGYTAVLLAGVSTNGHTRPYILWVQNGEILVAVKSTHGVFSMTLDGSPSTSSSELAIMATLSVDNYSNLNPAADLTGNTDASRWEIFSFPLNILDASGAYTINIVSDAGGGHDVNNVVFTVVIPTATANLTKTWVDGPMTPVTIQLYRKIGVDGTPSEYGSSVTLTPNASNQATYQWLSLPLTNASAQKYIYFIEEVDAGQGYDVLFQSSYNETTRTYTFTLQNTYSAPKGLVTTHQNSS